MLRLARDRNITLGFGVGDLHLVREQILGEEPGGQHLLRVRLVEYANAGPLTDHLRMGGVKLRNGAHGDLVIHKLLLRNIRVRGGLAHPRGTGGGIHRKQALARVQEVAGVA